jgi:hypothetical protein
VLDPSFDLQEFSECDRLRGSLLRSHQQRLSPRRWCIVQPPVREPSLEGGQRHRSGGQRVFSENSLLLKILVTRVK